MAVEATPIIKLEQGVSRAIVSFLNEKNIRRPLRIDLNFSGCCDASLCLCVDHVRENDLILEIEGVTFVISPETYELAGEITISYADEAGRKGFVIKSSRPVGEWAGFGVSDIKI
jgi:Fe-S cluster assembly iron-binding protein IscA